VRATVGKTASEREHRERLTKSIFSRRRTLSVGSLFDLSQRGGISCGNIIGNICSFVTINSSVRDVLVCVHVS